MYVYGMGLYVHKLDKGLMELGLLRQAPQWLSHVPRSRYNIPIKPAQSQATSLLIQDNQKASFQLGITPSSIPRFTTLQGSVIGPDV